MNTGSGSKYQSVPPLIMCTTAPDLLWSHLGIGGSHGLGSWGSAADLLKDQLSWPAFYLLAEAMIALSHNPSTAVVLAGNYCMLVVRHHTTPSDLELIQWGFSLLHGFVPLHVQQRLLIAMLGDEMEPFP